MGTGGRDVTAINSLLGMPVLSLETGNHVGVTRGLLIDPQNGVLSGLRLERGWLPYERIHSFGRDAIMAESEAAVIRTAGSEGFPGRDAGRIKGARVVGDNGEVVGSICNVHVTLKPPPFLIYEIRGSFLDWLLGRRIYIPASASHVLSQDTARLVVPQTAIEEASRDLAGAAASSVIVRTFAPVDLDEDETIVHPHDEDETIVRLRDEDETVVRRPPGATR